jgi:hypothetical protein
MSMKYTLYSFFLAATSLSANVALSPSSPLFSESGLLIAKESLATAKTGYYIDYMWKTTLKNSHHVTHARQSKLTQYGALALCLADLVDLYGFIGVANNTMHFKKEKTSYKYTQASHFSFALYADGILNQWGKWQLGGSGFYSSSPSNVGSLHKEGSMNQKADYQEYAWGASLGMSYDYPAIAPYIRLDYQFSKGQLSVFKDEFFHTMNPLGLAFGFISDLSWGLFVNFELCVIQTYSSKLLLGLRF